MDGLTGASVGERVKSFLNKQPCRGILLTVPGLWEAWFWLVSDLLNTGSEHLFTSAPMVYSASGYCWSDAISRSILRKADTVPRLAKSAGLFMRDECHLGIWKALDEKFVQHERWSGARDTWMRAVVSRTPAAMQ
jgi:hypothetical protein